MNAKRFFYVAAGLFFLTATISLGTQYVHAQGQENAQVVDVESEYPSGNRWVLDSLKRVIQADPNNLGWHGQVITTCPGPGVPVAIRRAGGGGFVFMADGDVWEFGPNSDLPGTYLWQLSGHVFSTLTDARQPPASKSWSSEKDAYRK